MRGVVYTVAFGVAVVTGSGAALACKQSGKVGHRYDISSISHGQIVTPVRLKTLYNGSHTIAERGEAKREVKTPLTKTRCLRPNSYEAVVLKADYDAAIRGGQPLHLSLDPNYDAKEGGARACMKVPVKDFEVAAVAGSPDKVTISFTLDETAVMSGERGRLLTARDEKPDRSQHVWCYTPVK